MTNTAANTAKHPEVVALWKAHKVAFAKHAKAWSAIQFADAARMEYGPKEIALVERLWNQKEAACRAVQAALVGLPADAVVAIITEAEAA